jgi:hypothetical protein
MSNTIDIIAELIGNATYIACPECGIGYNAEGCGNDLTSEGFHYIEYHCSECYGQWRFRWIPKDIENQTIHEEMFDETTCQDCYYTLDFDMLRKEMLCAKGKFATMKAFLDYYDINYGIEGYTIPQIYDNLKNKNYVRNQSYILYKLGRRLFD